MANLIDTTYFVNDISLPTSGTYSDVTAFITRFEKEILKQVLGYELWEYVRDYDANVSAQRIKDIVEGKEYTVSYNNRDQIIKWNGLKNDDKISLIAYYVYYQYMRAKATTTQVVGEVKPEQENSRQAQMNMKIMNTWTRLRELAGYSGQSDLQPSLYNFLLKYESTYPEWVFTDLGSVNSHDL